MWIAFTLGFFGSLHCLGMCGPLVVGTLQMQGDITTKSSFVKLLEYLLSKAVAYAVLGSIIGLIGELLVVGNLLKITSVIAGILLIIMFFLSLNIEQFLFKFNGFRKLYNRAFTIISRGIKKFGKKSTWIVGFFNGLLPCGLVYLALAGALMYNQIWLSALFMFIFGLGTLPALLAFGSGYQLISKKWKSKLNIVFPVLQLMLGVLLIYRGLYIDMPKELSFWDAMKNPIWCH